MENLQWEPVSLLEPALTIYKNNYIYFNSAMSEILEDAQGIEFFKAEKNGKTILSCKAGNQLSLLTTKEKGKRIVCKELINYIKSIYGEQSRFKLIFDEGYYILEPSES